MHLLRVFALAFCLVGLAHCSPILVPRVDRKLEPARNQFPLQLYPGNLPEQPVWYAVKKFPTGVMNIATLHREASAAFNWVKTQPNCLTTGGNVLVAAFYDHRKREIYFHTISRSETAKEINSLTGPNGIDQAPLWRSVRRRGNPTAETGPVDAEDGAYFIREKIGGPVLGKNYGNTAGNKDPNGSMIAVWGVMRTNVEALRNNPGLPKELCPDCQRQSDALGVYWEHVKSQGPTSGRQPGLPIRPASTPPNMPSRIPQPNSAPGSKLGSPSRRPKLPAGRGGGAAPPAPPIAGPSRPAAGNTRTPSPPNRGDPMDLDSPNGGITDAELLEMTRPQSTPPGNNGYRQRTPLNTPGRTSRIPIRTGTNPATGRPDRSASPQRTPSRGSSRRPRI